MPTTTPGTSLIARDGVNHRPLFGRVVHHRPHAAEQRLENRQADRGVALGRRHEDRAGSRGARAVVRVIVAVAEEQAVVVVGGVFRDVVDERGARRSLGVEPVELVAERVRLQEHALRPLAEHQRIPLVLDAEPADRNAVHLLDAGRAARSAT